MLSRIANDRRILFREVFTPASVAANGGIVTGGVTFGPDGATMDGTGYITYGNYDTFELGPEFSLRVKFKSSVLAPQRFISKAPDTVIYWNLGLDGAGKVHWQADDDVNKREIWSIEVYTDDQLHDVVVTRTIGGYAMYVDGNFSGSVTDSGSISNIASFLIGAGRLGLYKLQGGLELVEIYDSALTAEEVSLLHDNRLYSGFIEENCILFADYMNTQTSLNWKDTDGTHTDTDILYKHGLGAEFNGSTSAINYGNPNTLNFGTGDFTIEVVSKSRFADHTADWDIIFSKYADATNYNYCYYRNVNSLIWTPYGGGAITIAVDDVTQFHHFVFQRSGTSTIAYLDGQHYVTSVIPNSHDFNDAADFWLGRRIIGGHYLKGNIPYMRICKGKALTASEVRQNYQAAVDGGYFNG